MKEPRDNFHPEDFMSTKEPYTFYNFFDTVAEFITSMAIVLIVMVPFMGYRFFEVYTLFYKWLPVENEDNKSIASSLISLVIIIATLIFMVNSENLFKGYKVILALVAFIINLMFWSMTEQPVWWFILFISAMIASMDYAFAHLFDRKWNERNLVANIVALSTSNSELKQLNKELNAKRSDLKQDISELEANRYKITCPHCKELKNNQNAYNAHVHHCKYNPVNL